MKNPIVVIGMGEMGAVFARGFLRAGYPVYPVTRDNSVKDIQQHINKAGQCVDMVLVAVGEAGLQDVLKTIPCDWHDRLVLLQNELLPRDWKDYPKATVISVWFEKKKGQDSKVILPSPAYGPLANILADAMDSIDIPVRVLQNDADLLFELVVKNLYILTSNIAGLKVGGTVGELWTQHRQVAEGVLSDVIQLQQTLTGAQFDRSALTDAMLNAFDGDPEHKCMGRSAPARLARALEIGQSLGLELPHLQAIANEQ